MPQELKIQTIQTLKMSLNTEHWCVITVQDAINWVSDAWNKTAPTAVLNCDMKAGFKALVQVDAHVSEDPIEEIVEVVKSTGIQEFNESWGRLNHIKKTTTNSNYFLNIDAAIAFHSLVF